MFYILDNNKIVLVDSDKEQLKNTLLFMPNYKEAEILETEKEIVNINGSYYFSDDEEVEKYNKEVRKQEILTELETLDNKSIRALRANETDRLEELEKQAVELREELSKL